MRITCKLRSQCPLFARAANVRWFRSGTKYGRSLAITGNNEKSGCKNAGKIGEILGKILDNPESITKVIVGNSFSCIMTRGFKKMALLSLLPSITHISKVQPWEVT